MLTSILLLAVGLVALIAGMALFVVRLSRYRLWLRVSGLVVELIPKTKNDGDRRIVVYSPRVSFRVASGESVEFVSAYSSKPAVAAAGETVRVLYDPAAPQKAEIDSFLFRHMVELLLVSSGLVLVLIFVYERFAV
jgi:hypothetical protein